MICLDPFPAEMTMKLSLQEKVSEYGACMVLESMSIIIVVSFFFIRVIILVHPVSLQKGTPTNGIVQFITL